MKSHELHTTAACAAGAAKHARAAKAQAKRLFFISFLLWNASVGWGRWLNPCRELDVRLCTPPCDPRFWGVGKLYASLLVFLELIHERIDARLQFLVLGL